MSRRLFLILGLGLIALPALVGLAQVAMTWFLGVVVVLGSLALVWIARSFPKLLRPGPDLHRAERLARFRDASPADGVVGIAALESVEAEPIPGLEPFLRFTRERSDESIRPAKLESRNPPLLGRVAVVSIFLGRHGMAWSENEIAQAHEELNSAATWIEQEALRWSAGVNLELSQVVFVHEETVEEDVEVVLALESASRGLWDRDTEVKHLSAVSRAARAWGFADGADLLARTNARLDAEAVVWVLHHRSAGRSVAIPAARAQLPGVGIAVLYSRYANLPEPLGDGEAPWPDPLTLAHEMFHLFGATDKYGHRLSRYALGTVTNRDIMRLGAKTLTQHEVGPLTAYEVGWLVDLPTGESVAIKRQRPAASRRRRGRAF